MRRAFLSLLILAILTGPAFGPSAPWNEGAKLVRNPGSNTWTFFWWGQFGRTYFIQQSEDLVHWIYWPEIVSGDDEIVECGLDNTGDRLYLRLQPTDLPADDPYTDDFDGDGLANEEEVALNLNPLEADTDGDGTSDGDEITAGSDPGDPGSAPAPLEMRFRLWKKALRLDIASGGDWEPEDPFDPDNSNLLCYCNREATLDWNVWDGLTSGPLGEGLGETQEEVGETDLQNAYLAMKDAAFNALAGEEEASVNADAVIFGEDLAVMTEKELEELCDFGCSQKVFLEGVWAWVRPVSNRKPLAVEGALRTTWIVEARWLDAESGEPEQEPLYGLVTFVVPVGKTEGFVELSGELASVGVHGGGETSTPPYEHVAFEPPAVEGKRIKISIPPLPVDIDSDKATIQPKYRGSTSSPYLCNNINHIVAGEKIEGALTIYHKAVRDEHGETEDFDVTLKVAPFENVTWTKVAGPDSGELVNANSPTAIFRNPKKGGLYEFNLSIAGQSTAGKLQLWLPVAGPDISSYIENEIAYFKGTWGPAYRSELNDRTILLALNPPARWMLKRELAALDMLTIGSLLDWNGEILGDETPCGGRIPPPGVTPPGNNLTLHSFVISWSKRNNMMYALIGREMGLPERMLINAGHLINIISSGGLDSAEAVESYSAGFDLFNGGTLEDVMTARALKMHQPDGWDQWEWPSHETSEDELQRMTEQELQDLTE